MVEKMATHSTSLNTLVSMENHFKKWIKFGYQIKIFQLATSLVVGKALHLVVEVNRMSLPLVSKMMIMRRVEKLFSLQNQIRKE